MNANPQIAQAALLLSDWIDENEIALDNFENGAAWLRDNVLGTLIAESAQTFDEDDLLAAADENGIARVQGVIPVSLSDMFGGIEHVNDIASSMLVHGYVLQDIEYECVGCVERPTGNEMLLHVFASIDTEQF